VRTLALVAALVAATAATAQNAYRYVMPDGRVVYSDQPVPGARLEATIVPPAPVTPSAAGAPRLSASEEALLRASDERFRRLNELALQIQEASRDLADANAALQAGIEPLEAERIGTFAGRARLNDAYWARQEANQRAVANAQARLDRAVAERNALR
jgi:hypothetical protein